MFKTFQEETLDERSQVKIERFLMNQAQIYIDRVLASKVTTKRNGALGIFVNRKIDSEVANQMIESKSDFKQLITNYKKNIEEVCLNDSDNLSPNHIIYALDTDLIISYSYGRLLRILSNFQMINKDNMLLEVSVSIGKEFVRDFLFETYKRENTEKNLTYLDWKTSNNKKVELVQDSNF